MTSGCRKVPYTAFRRRRGRSLGYVRGYEILAGRKVRNRGERFYLPSFLNSLEEEKGDPCLESWFMDVVLLAKQYVTKFTTVYCRSQGLSLGEYAETNIEGFLFSDEWSGMVKTKALTEVRKKVQHRSECTAGQLFLNATSISLFWCE